MALVFLFQMFKKLTKQLNGGRLELKYPQHLGTGLSTVNSWDLLLQQNRFYNEGYFQFAKAL
jgi:hypothetical protein